MNRIIFTLLALIFSVTLLANPVENFNNIDTTEKGLDEKVDELFKDYTGWFVNAIFYSIPISEISQQKELNYSDTFFSIEATKDQDSIKITNISMKDGYIAKEVKSKDDFVRVIDGGLIVNKSKFSKHSIIVQLSSPRWQIPWVLFVLIGGAIFFTFYFKFINFTKIKTAIKIVQGKYDFLEKEKSPVTDSVHHIDGDNPDTIKIEGKEYGEVSHFQALTAALSATVGLGNIAGVAIALSIGGAGATFWMIVAGLIGMASKFTECTLGVKYREIGKDGTVFGGPMYYLKKGLAEKKMVGFGKILAVIFAIMCIGGSFGGGNMFQTNQAFKMFEYATGGEKSFIHGYGWLFGLVMAVLVGIVIIGGIKKIAKVTDKIVPFMVVVYIIAVLVVLGANISMIPQAFGEIFDGAFTGAGITGGIIGVLVQGFKRAAFSNEAGIGSASIAHSAAKTKYAASEGLVALLEPLIDTVIVCTMTALVIIITGKLTVGDSLSFNEGVVLTSSAFETILPWFRWVLMTAVILFAFSSMISWSYYGAQAWAFLFGRGRLVSSLYKFIFCIFVIIGSASSLGSVMDFSDAMIFSMLVPNIIGLIILAPKAKQELYKYINKIKTAKQKS